MPDLQVGQTTAIAAENSGEIGVGLNAWCADADDVVFTLNPVAADVDIAAFAARVIVGGLITDCDVVGAALALIEGGESCSSIKAPDGISVKSLITAGGVADAGHVVKKG